MASSSAGAGPLGDNGPLGPLGMLDTDPEDGLSDGLFRSSSVTILEL